MGQWDIETVELGEQAKGTMHNGTMRFWELGKNNGTMVFWTMGQWTSKQWSRGHWAMSQWTMGQWESFLC